VNPTPRFGFAYDVFGNGKTSVRGAYGLSYVALIGQMANQNAQPFGFDVRTRNVGPISDPYRFIDNPFGRSVDLSNPVYSLPIAMAEQQVAPATAVHVSYVGSLGRHEGTVRQQNPAVYIPGRSTAQNIESRRLYAPTFGQITGYAADGTSSYNALQIQVTRQFQKGFTYSSYYTFSQAIDEANRGIGRAIARRLSAEAARVMIAGLNGDLAAAVAAALREAGGASDAVPVDVTDPEQVRRMVRAALDAFWAH
jgi:hypothetical protein